MSAQALAATALRLIAVYTVWNSIRYLPMLVLAEFPGDNPIQGEQLLAAMLLLTPSALAVALWHYADALAGLVADCREQALPDEPPAAVGGAELHAIAISTLGLGLLIWTLPRPLTLLTHNLTLDEDEANLAIGALDMAVPVLQAGLALTMVFGAGLWRDAIRRFKGFGLQQK